MTKPIKAAQHVDCCEHKEGSYVGQLGQFDVHVEETPQGFTTCLRYGEDGEYISGGAGAFRDAQSMAKNLIGEHERQVEKLEEKIKLLETKAECLKERMMPLNIVTTPANWKELEDWVNAHGSEERAHIYVAAVMAWNLSCKTISEAI